MPCHQISGDRVDLSVDVAWSVCELRQVRFTGHTAQHEDGVELLAGHTDERLQTLEGEPIMKLVPGRVLEVNDVRIERGFLMIVNLTYGGEVQLWNGSSGGALWLFHACAVGSSWAQVTPGRMDG